MPRVLLIVLIYFLFLLSGATALVYEVAWSRTFVLIFGATHEAISIVLASFMAGLALGGLYFGRRSRTVRRPLRLYGYLELGIALSALLVPLALAAVDDIYVALAVRTGEVNAFLNFLRAAMAFVVLVVPTFLMGGTLPLLVRFLVTDRSEFGMRLAGLYGTNTVGAVVGVVLSGFFLLPWLGVWATQLAAIAVNVLIGVGAILAAWRMEAPSREQVKESDAPLAVDRAGASDLPIPWALRLAYIGAGVSGFCALALEVLWTRAISISTGLSTYSFTVMLAAFLAGIALGSWLHAALPLRRIPESVQFGAVLVLIGTASLAVSQIVPRLPHLATELNVRFHSGFGVRTGTALVVSLAVMLVPCTLMGVAFPLAGQARARMRQAVGKSVGDVFGWNTFGAILGSLAAGFFLIPALGLQRGMHVVSALYAAYGIVVLGAWAFPRRVFSQLAVGGVIVVLVVSIFLLALSIPRWDARIMGAFSHNSPGLYVRGGEVDIDRALADARVLYYEEGRASTVSVYERMGIRSMQVDGKTLASDGLDDLHVELLLGHVPALVHPEPRSAAVIGLGAGITLGAVAAHDSIERLVLVEIEPAVYGAADQFKDVHGDALRRDGLEIVYQDGRNYMLTSRERFDVITADPIHPWVRGAAYLFTTEYYALLADHLTPGGVMCQWLPVYELSEENVKSVLGTFARNFQHTSVWLAANDIVLIGSNAPIEIDLQNLASRLAAPSVAGQLRHIGLASPLSFLTQLTLDDATVRKFAEGATINTDDNLYLEFSSPLNTSRANHAMVAHIVSNQTALAEMLTNLPEHLGADDLERALNGYRWAKRLTLQATFEVHTLPPTKQNLAQILGRLERVRQRVPGYGRARVLFAYLVSNLAEQSLKSGDLEGAIRNSSKALEIRPGYGRAHRMAGRALNQLERFEEAITEFRKDIESQSLRYWESYEPLSTALAALGRQREAIRVLEEGLAVRPRDDRLIARLSWLLATSPEPDLRDGPRAAQLAQKAIAGSDRPAPFHFEALAAALAETGRFPEAVKCAEEAVRLAKRNGERKVLQGMRARLDLYRSGKPWRDGLPNNDARPES